MPSPLPQCQQNPQDLSPTPTATPYYDTETGLYYLNTRYYDPAVGRFLNLDCQLNLLEGTTGYNLFQYCGNNPVMYKDSDGASYEYGDPVDNQDGTHTITITVTTESGSVTIVFGVDDATGFTWLSFHHFGNDYGAIKAIGGELDLSEGMIEATRSIRSSYLNGRTAEGVALENNFHYYLDERLYGAISYSPKTTVGRVSNSVIAIVAGHASAADVGGIAHPSLRTDFDGLPFELLAANNRVNASQVQTNSIRFLVTASISLLFK